MYTDNSDSRKGVIGGGPPAPAALKVKSLTPLTNASAQNNSHTTSNNNMTPTDAGELAELTTSEISLDLQGLIDDSHFGDDNLFGDLIEAKKNELNHGYGLPGNRHSPSGSLGGSSGQSSPVGVSSHPGGVSESSPPNYPPYRNALSYLPGSVHSGAGYTGGTAGPGMNNNNNNNNNNNVQVKQEPQDAVSSAGSFNQAHPRNNNNNGSGSNNNNNSNGNGFSTVSSTTPNHNNHGVVPHNNTLNFPSMNTVLPALKSFAQMPKYLQPHSSSGPAAIKKKMDRNSDEYR